jgi:hypothetical protein
MNESIGLPQHRLQPVTRPRILSRPESYAYTSPRVKRGNLQRLAMRHQTAKDFNLCQPSVLGAIGPQTIASDKHAATRMRAHTRG